MKPRIDRYALEQIAQANKGRRGYTYTHYPWMDATCPDEQWNRMLIQYSNTLGFTINASCETAEQADLAVSLGIPAVLVVPEDAPNTWHTPAGNLVKTCPAVLHDHITCQSCDGLCQKQELTGPGGVKRPRHIIAFPLHGSGKGKAAKIIKELRVVQ